MKEPLIVIKAAGLVVITTSARSMIIHAVNSAPPNAPGPSVPPDAELSVSLITDLIHYELPAGTMRSTAPGAAAGHPGGRL